MSDLPPDPLEETTRRIVELSEWRVQLLKEVEQAEKELRELTELIQPKTSED